MISEITATPAFQRKPLLVTLGIHAALLLLLFFWRFSLPGQLIPLPEMGMEVNLGTSPDGSGTDQPLDMEDPAAEASAASRNAASTSSSNDVERSEDDDAPGISDPSNNRGRRAANISAQRAGNTSAATTAVTAQQQRPRYVYPGSTGRGGNRALANASGASEGNTTGDGDRGVAGGTPGSPNYTGAPGAGTGGISHSLDGRGIVAFPPKEARFREGGRVTVRVTVNREGTIVNQQVVRSTNAELTPIALNKLKQVRFNRSETAPQEQFGNITFDFKTRQ